MNQIDWPAIRAEFPILTQKFPILTAAGADEAPLAYFDVGASTQLAKRFQADLVFAYNHYYANVSRGAHTPSQISTERYEDARAAVQEFLNGDPETHDVIFTSNTTDGLNLAAHLVKDRKGIVLSTDLEHHSNYLPYLRHGRVELVGLKKDGSLNLGDLQLKLSKHKVKLVAVTGASNVTGVMPDLVAISKMTHEAGAFLLVDAAQLIAHSSVDVSRLGIDMLAAAGHKFYAPGAGFLYAPKELLNSAEPYQPGGGTINYVIDNKRIGWAASPDRHEGGTPPIVGAILLGEGLRWLKSIGLDVIRAHEKALLDQLMAGLMDIEGVTVYGPLATASRVGVVSFNVRGYHNSLVATILNYEYAIAVRDGCHCAHRYVHRLLRTPEREYGKLAAIMDKRAAGMVTEAEFKRIPGTVRASIGIFVTEEDIDRLLTAVRHIAGGEIRGRYSFNAKAGGYRPDEPIALPRFLPAHEGD